MSLDTTHRWSSTPEPCRAAPARLNIRSPSSPPGPPIQDRCTAAPDSKPETRRGLAVRRARRPSGAVRGRAPRWRAGAVEDTRVRGPLWRPARRGTYRVRLRVRALVVVQRQPYVTGAQSLFSPAYVSPSSPAISQPRREVGVVHHDPVALGRAPAGTARGVWAARGMVRGVCDADTAGRARRRTRRGGACGGPRGRGAARRISRSPPDPRPRGRPESETHPARDHMVATATAISPPLLHLLRRRTRLCWAPAPTYGPGGPQ